MRCSGQRFRAASAHALFVLATACGKLYEYPTEQPENTREACVDGRDTDHDGLKDCEDPDCDGFCAEESASACEDQRDNDGDGLTDALDARCWVWAAPTVARCAEARGTELFDNFDSPSLQGDRSASWISWSTSRTYPDLRPSTSGVLTPPVLAFSGAIESATGGDAASVSWAASLASVVRQRPFSGSWEDFELSFTTSVPPQALLRVAVVPMELAPSVEPPVEGAESALLALTLDTSHVPPTLALTVEGATSQADLPSTNSLCGGTLCTAYPGKVSVGLDESGFRASLAYPNGVTTEVRARAPSSLGLPPSRLVFWGGSAHWSIEARVDDLHLSVKPEWPCGFQAPQIPGSGCEFAGKLGAFGQSVSVARGVAGEYCALVAASRDARSLPASLTAWRSPDGEQWSAAAPPDKGSSELPDGAALIGAGLAADDVGWHAAVTYREDGAVRLGFLDGEGCGELGALQPGPVLADDAESPSYVVTGQQHYVYFTRPPLGRGRTLWRIARDAPDAPPERLAELPPDVAAPVSLARAGAIDLVLTYPGAAGLGYAGGVGLLVGRPDARTWQPVTQALVLEVPSRQDAPEGKPLAYDSEGVVAAALAWHEDGGFVLYGGRSTYGLAGGTHSEPLETELAVGTARMAPKHQDLRPTGVTPVDRCGDGACGARESCTSCTADCPCSGVSLVRDVLTERAPWRILSSDPSPGAFRYFRSDPPSLNFGSAGPTWSVLPLERAITGDFELSFDLLVGYTLPTGETCSAYVGLGTTPELGPATQQDEVAPPSGIFAHVGIDLSCADKFHAAPFVVTEDSLPAVAQDAASCADAQALPMDEWQRVVLRREASEVSLSTPRPDRCGAFEKHLTYTSPLGGLPALLVGFGGGAFGGCPVGERAVGVFGSPIVSHGTIRNLELRLPEDPADCPEPKQRCGSGSEEPSCTDLAQSVEHCGSCGEACAKNESCVDGRCGCSDVSGIVECDDACVDSRTNREHCGGCGHACDGECVDGVCAAVGDCPAPFELEPAGGSVTLELAPGNAAARLCERVLFGPALVAWTPGETATAVIEVVAGDASLELVLGVARDDQTSCGSWVVCNDGAQNVGSGPRLRLSVDAGATYLLGVGLSSPGPKGAELELRVGFER